MSNDKCPMARLTEDGVAGTWMHLHEVVTADVATTVLGFMDGDDADGGWLGDGTDEPAWLLLEGAIGRRDADEGRPMRARLEVMVDGRIVLDAEAALEWGDEEPEGDAAPTADPIGCWGDAGALRRCLETVEARR